MVTAPFGSGKSPSVIQPEDARFHTYIIGKTGSGKSTLLRNLILQHIQLGHGIAIIDPHGDLAEVSGDKKSQASFDGPGSPAQTGRAAPKTAAAQKAGFR